MLYPADALVRQQVFRIDGAKTIEIVSMFEKLWSKILHKGPNSRETFPSMCGIEMGHDIGGDPTELAGHFSIVAGGNFGSSQRSRIPLTGNRIASPLGSPDLQ